MEEGIIHIQWQGPYSLRLLAAARDWAILAVHSGPHLSLLHEDLRTVLALKGSLRRATTARP